MKSTYIKLQKHKTQSPSFCTTTYTLSENQLHSYNKQKKHQKITVQWLVYCRKLITSDQDAPELSQLVFQIVDETILPMPLSSMSPHISVHFSF